jgi:hypothetical protein
MPTEGYNVLTYFSLDGLETQMERRCYVRAGRRCDDRRICIFEDLMRPEMHRVP